MNEDNYSVAPPEPLLPELEVEVGEIAILKSIRIHLSTEVVAVV